ncbi:MAG TPA: hypothetical protein GXZ82_05735 [Firmicutes bacterium]|jgi:hypothetical protein|nr:hypothetical protein [Bacillota bacterium]
MDGVAEHWLNTHAIIGPLHQAAVEHGCRYRIDVNDDGTTIVYSARDLTITLQGELVSFSSEYDIRSFLRLYRETESDRVRRLLFDAAIPCCYCGDDKCTTLLMAKQRTIHYQGDSKKLCGPYRHQLTIAVNLENLSACVEIINMMLDRVHPYMHRDLAEKPNQVTYRLTELDDFYLVGYAYKHSPLSMADEEFVMSLLKKDDTGWRKIDALSAEIGSTHIERFVGAVDDFRHGASYTFIFGVMTNNKPAVLPDGAVCRKVRRGEWAVYNSAAGDYKSIWRHFTARFYKLEHKGYDDSRIPFEYYDAAGRCFDVHIPVDADMPADKGMVLQITHTPNEKMAGFRTYAETDYPLYQDRPFDAVSKLGDLFPHALCLVRVSIHSLFGKPLMGFDGVPVDDLSVITEDVELYEMQGGYWKRIGWKHFNGDYEAWGEAFSAQPQTALPVWDIHHPRGFNMYLYKARGGYCEIGIPMRLLGNRRFDVVELTPQQVFGKLEAPPESMVTEGDIRRFYSMTENREPGTYVIAYTVTVVDEGQNMRVYYDEPLIQGVLAEADLAVPAGLQSVTLDGGLYVKVTEDIPNGVLGWEAGGITAEIPQRTGHAYDSARRFIYKQCDYGKRYELYVPVRPL